MDIHANLEAAGLVMPKTAAPAGVYVPAITVGGFVHVAGQIPVVDGKLLATGPVPSSVSIERARAAAQQCLLNALAAVDAQLDGDWTRFVRVVRLGAFVCSDDTFTGQAQVANGASELLGRLFGPAGEHARTTIGVNALPLGATVEVDLAVQVR